MLACGKYVKGVKDSGKQFLLSVYTPIKEDAYSIAYEASVITNQYGVTYHNYHNKKANGTLKQGVFFQHYHPSPIEGGLDCNGVRIITPHAFFGTPLNQLSKNGVSNKLI